MEELIAQLKTFLGSRISEIVRTGAAEIDLVVEENEDIEALSADLQSNIVALVGQNTLAKINLISADGEVKASFPLNQ